MHIESIAVANYKSFHEKQTMHLTTGFNLLVGTNNSGKTTLLDVMDLAEGLNDPHRSQQTIPEYGLQAFGQSQFEVRIRTRVNELRRLLPNPNQLLLPVVDSAEGHERMLAHAQEFFRLDRPLEMEIQFGAGVAMTKFQAESIVSGSVPSFSPQAGLMTAATYQSGAELPASITLSEVFGSADFGRYYQALRQRIYRFSAQRRPSATSGMVDAMALELDREATQLPYFLNRLQTNDAEGHRLLCGWLQRIFPSVAWVQAPPAPGGFEIRCLPLLPSARRDDLAKPLSQMGAGIGHVIAMLYVVLTAREPRVIAIDEPNAFLHPRALRELLAILEVEGRQHQFILTAHSPDVLTAVTPSTISLLDFDGTATQIRQVERQQLHEVRGSLADLGIRMTDLHAKDRVLWVEGQTEELILPAMLRLSCPEVAAGTAVLRVERTGTFSTKGIDPAEVAATYQRLSGASALVPPLVAILLDSEEHAADKLSAIAARSNGALAFLPNRMIENYFLHPAAICATLNALGESVEAAEVEEALRKSLGEAQDLVGIDGARVLKDVFAILSEARQEFRKTRDVPALCSWLITHEPDHIEPLTKFLRQLFELPVKSCP